ncbi:2779_t:CDS:10 [Acaulospora morrowiae]|uniref:General negative regulator of transcription subunit n=1 Tax=Acaulospora morrowiae TaxID=94023 RepID=A0A9N8WFX2_9GLOM|nr:2779_t:CDS:10 [Acaulospora morrowiae]
MEKFKACEKEMKTKAYSKEGLQQSIKMDPKEKEKIETCEFISNQIDALATQIETAEAEVELLQSVVKKGRKDAAKIDRLAKVESTIERHKFHVNRLELILRLLENGNILPEKVIQIQEDIKYYVENNQDPDFTEDEVIYDDLNLEEEEELWGITNDDHHNNDESNSDESRTPPKEPSSPATSPTTRIAATKTVPSRKTSNAFESLPQRQKEEEKTKLPPPPISTGVTVTSPPPTSATFAPLKSASLTGSSRTVAAVAKQGIDTVPQVSIPQRFPPATSVSTTQENSTAPQPPVPPVQTNSTSSESIDVTKQQFSQPNDVLQAKQPRLPPQSSQPTQQHISPSPSQSQQQQQNREIPVVQPPQTPTHPLQPSDMNVADQSKQDGSSNHESSSSGENRIPEALADLVPSYEAAEEKSLGKEDNFHIQQMLDASYQHVPESIDSERPKYYVPRNPYHTPSHYPQSPTQIFDNPALFEKFDIDTLFFIFYYQQGTYQQYLAARELKKQSWRFHKKYLTWFQRHEEPKAITDEYEQGTYIYFDYEGAWCQRKKTEFRFEYRFLEDADLI